MAITFQGGQSLPTQGTAAYAALQGQSNSNNTNTPGLFVPSTNTLTAGTTSGSGVQTLYSPTQSGGPTTSSPVITSQEAQDDAIQKQIAFNTMQSQNATQAQTLVEQQAQARLEQSVKDQQAQQQKNIDTQNNLAAQQTATKNAALLGTGNVGTGNTSTNTSQANTNTPPAAPNTPDTTNTTDQTGAGTSSDSIQDTLDTATNNDVSQQSAISTEEDTAYQQYQTQLNSIMSGTFPLSSTETSLISSLQTQLQQNVQQQQTANNAYTGAATEAGFRSGGEYTPTQYAGQIANSISYGVAKIQDLDNSAALTMAQLQQSFQTEDLTAVNDGYDALTKQLSNKSTEIQTMYDTVTGALKDQRDAAATASKTAFDEQMSSATFNLTAAQDANDDAYKNAQLTEQEYKDNQDLINQRTTQSIDAYNAGLISGGTFNPATGSFTQADGTQGQSPSTLPGYSALPNGSSIVQHPNGDTFMVNSDGSLTKFKSNTDASTFTSSANAANTVNQMQTLFNKINSETSGATTSGGANSQKSQDIATYNSLLSTLPVDVKPLVPGVSQGSGGIFSSPQSATATQFTSAYSSLNQKMIGAMPSATPPVFGKTFSSGADLISWASQTGNTAQLTAWHNQGYSDEQILQMVNG